MKKGKISTMSIFEHIRLRPYMYTAGKTPEKVLFQELLSNAIDEFIAGKVSKVYITHR